MSIIHILAVLVALALSLFGGFFAARMYIMDIRNKDDITTEMTQKALIGLLVCTVIGVMIFMALPQDWEFLSLFAGIGLIIGWEGETIAEPPTLYR